MRNFNIIAFDIPDAWFQCIDEILKNGYEYEIQRGSFEGEKRKGLDFVTIKISNPSTRPLIPEIPQHLEHDCPNPTSLDYVYSYFEKLVTPFKEETEDYTYGERLSGFNVDGGIQLNQIEEVIKMYGNGFGTNQACMEVGCPSDILLTDPPCLRLVDTRIRYNRLHFICYFRSWDAYAGLPSNLAALQLLKEYMAKKISVNDGEIIACSKGLHLYSYQWEWAKKRVLATNF